MTNAIMGIILSICWFSTGYVIGCAVTSKRNWK